MLKIHKPTHIKLFLINITSILSISVLLGFSALTYTPELSHAETIQYPPEEIHPNLSDITYMQDMSKDICINSDVNDTKQLIDKRDSNTYWVTKLRDNNCWMTQNLAVNLSTTNELNNILSDVDNWTPDSDTQYNVITNFPTDSNGLNNATFSYNPGEYIYRNPSIINTCGTLSNHVSNLSSCKGWEYAPELSKDTSGNTDAHYLAGNYYSWGAATAGQASKLSENTSPNQSNQSICPKNWILPSASMFEQLSVNLNYIDMVNPPYFIVHAGYVYETTLYLTGAMTYTWTSTRSGKVSAMTFSTGVQTGTLVNPIIAGALRYGGNTVRCVVEGGKKPNNINIEVNPQLSLEVPPEVIVTKSDINPSTANLDAKVVSNQPYSVSISSTSPNMTSSTSSTAIPSKSGTLTSNENAWGIKLSTASAYEQITTTPKLFYSSISPESKTIPFTIGISTAPDIPNGDYSTNITVTATQN